MWLPAAILVCTISGWLMLRPVRELQDFPTRVLLVVLWFRQVLQAFPEFTLYTSVAGLRLVALFSILMAAALVAVADQRLFRLRYFLSFYALFSLVVVSSVLNGTIDGLIRVSAKWAFFIGVLTLTYRAVALFGVTRIVNGLLWIMTIPIGLQVFSIILGKVKATEADGSASYIGGYYHESTFSEVVFTMIVLASLRAGKQGRTVGLMVIGLISLLLANYRTSIIAAAPIVATFFSRKIISLWGPELRTWIAAIGAAMAIAAIPLVIPLLPDRYADVAHFANNASVLAQQPEYLSFEQRMTFSGRIYLWTQYLDVFRNADFVHKVLGFGAEAWDGRMHAYAHNTFISYLFEYGLIGLGLLLYLMISNIILCLNVRDMALRFQLVSAHVGFILFNLATMPLWSNEGLTVYAIVLAVTWASQGHVSAQQRPSGPQPIKRNRAKRFRL